MADERIRSIKRLLAKRQWQVAEQSCQELLRDEPRHLEALNLLGGVQCELGNFADAEQTVRRSLDWYPHEIGLRRNLARVLQLQGNCSESLAEYERTLRLAPQDAQSQFGIAEILESQNKPARAIGAYQNALSQRPNWPAAQLRLACLLHAAGRLDEAAEHCNQIIKLNPAAAETHRCLGNIFLDQGRGEAAVKEYQEVVRLIPNQANEYCNVALAMSDIGQFEEAIKCLERALRIEPNCVHAHRQLGQLAVQGYCEFSSEQRQRLNDLLADDQLSADDRCGLESTLGDLLDKEANYEDAFAAYRRVNKIKHDLRKEAGKEFKIANHRVWIDDIIEVFGTAFLREKRAGSSDSKTPVFVVGMPRSGTTLVEQIIASHPEAAGAGELRDIARLAAELTRVASGHPKYPRCVQNADARSFRGLADRYLVRLREYGNNAQRVVNKTPGNFLYLGFIAMLFPHARVIHCQRDPLDIGLSCFTRNFEAIDWAWRLKDIGAYYCEYVRLMDHWREALPLDVHEVSYEKLVAEPDEHIRAIIDHCGLQWSDRCLRFHDNENAVRTASRFQVRRPVYSTSAGRWKNYAAHLAPLQAAVKNAGR